MVRFQDITNKDGSYIPLSFPGTQYASASYNRGTFFNVSNPIEIISVSISYKIKDGAGATFNLEKLASGQSSGSGTSIVGFDLTTTTGEKKPWTKTRLDFDQTIGADGLLSFQVKEGFRLGFLSANAGDTIDSLNVTIYFKHLNKGDYR